MPFIIITGVKNSDPDTRKIIRSHVMMGKNRGKPRPRKAINQLPNYTDGARQELIDPAISLIQSHSVIPAKLG
jgi:hypothetical protein